MKNLTLQLFDIAKKSSDKHSKLCLLRLVKEIRTDKATKIRDWRKNKST